MTTKAGTTLAADPPDPSPPPAVRLLRRRGVEFTLTVVAVLLSVYGDPRESKQIVNGEVVARTGLVLRSAPTRGGSVIRVARYGEIVKIYCRAEGQSVDGNRQWYLLVDGTWAWGSARFIAPFKAPRWCDA